MALPPELLRHILLQLEPGTDESIETLQSFSLCCHHFHDLPADLGLWSLHLRARYKRGHDPDSTLDNVNHSAASLLSRRLRMDREALKDLTTMTRSTATMDPVFSDARACGQHVVEAIERQVASSRTSHPDEWMTRTYWANKLHRAILRDWATSAWKAMGRDDWEKAAAAFCAFRGVHPLDVSDEFDRLAKALERSLAHVVEAATDKEVIDHVVRFMRENGFVPATPEHFHDIENHFLSTVQSNARAGKVAGTLPMTLVITFCALINRLPSEWAISARPISFPGIMLAQFTRTHTHARTRDAANEEASCYVNIYETGVIMHVDRLRALVDTMNAAWSDDYLLPATSHSIAFRIAQNIVTSIRSHDLDAKMRMDCLYASATACVLCARAGVNTTIYTSWLCSLIESAYPEDASYLIQLRSEGLQGNIDTRLLHDEIVDTLHRSPTPKRRNEDVVRWPVGKMFRHRLFGYWAVTTGYDERCEAGEQWIAQMQVDRLPLGRAQPFYNVYCEDDSQRYVAQENIPERSARFEGDGDGHARALADNVELGKYFLRSERIGVGREGELRFVPNARMRAEFPDDAALFTTSPPTPS